MVFYDLEVLPLLRISIHIFGSDLISQVHFFDSLYVRIGIASDEKDKPT